MSGGLSAGPRQIRAQAQWQEEESGQAGSSQQSVLQIRQAPRFKAVASKSATLRNEMM